MKAKVLACLLLAPFCANATPINWTLQDVVIGTFINGNSFPNAGDTVSLTGSFTYDADLNIYSNINIHSAPGTGLICAFPDQVPPNSECQGFFLASMPAANYNYAATDSTASILITLDSTKFFDGLLGDPLLALKFASNLSNLGGSVGFAENSVEYLCPEVLTCPFDSKKNAFRFVRYTDTTDPVSGLPVPYSGRVVATTSVPEPSTLALCGIAVFAFGFRRSRKASVPVPKIPRTPKYFTFRPSH